MNNAFTAPPTIRWAHHELATVTRDVAPRPNQMVLESEPRAVRRAKAAIFESQMPEGKQRRWASK